MINELVIYRCYCSKCSHSWNTKTKQIPTVCAKCHSVKWNDDYSFDTPTAIDPPMITPIVDPVTIPVVPAAGAMSEIADFIAKAQAAKGITQPIVEPVEIADEWIFTKDAPQFADDGNVYRQQYLASNPKRKRSVQVDDFDHEKIIS